MVCTLIVAYFLVLLLARFHFLAINDGPDYLSVSSQEMWGSVLLISLIAAISGSVRVPARNMRRWQALAVYVFRGFVACYFLLVLLQDRLLVPCLVHITVAGIQSAQPLRFAADAVVAGSRARTMQFYHLTSIGAAFVPVCCILLWQLAVRWRAGVAEGRRGRVAGGKPNSHVLVHRTDLLR